MAEDTNLFERLSVHQDFPWFVALLGWSLALVIWRWHPQRQAAWRWLPWVAGTCLVAVLVQFAIFSPPFNALYERTMPVANGRQQIIPPAIRPEVAGDLITGAVLAFLAAAWTWIVTAPRPSRWRWLVWPAAVGVAFLHRWHQGIAMSLLTLAMLVTRPALRRSSAADGIVGLAQFLLALFPVVSPVGPLALLDEDPLRERGPAPIGLLAALVQALAALCVLIALLRGTLRPARGGTVAALWREDRALVVVGLAWLAAGVTFALHAGVENRRQFLENFRRTVDSRAKAVSQPVVDQLSKAFPLHLERVVPPPEPYQDGSAQVPAFVGGLGRAMDEDMFRKGVPPFAKRAGYFFVVDGWVIAVPAGVPPDSGHVGVIRRASEQDLEDWNGGRAVLDVNAAPEIGRDLMGRAPILDRTGTIVGWFGLVRSEFIGSVERKHRAIPLLLTAMGLVVTGTFFFQRRAARERHAALRDAEVSEEASRVKTAFLAKVSHELRTPIQSLLGYSELLRRQVSGDPRAEAWLNAIRQHGELMTRLVNDLIDLSAVEAGTFRLAPRPLAPADLVRQTVESLRPRAEAKALALRCDVGAGVPPWIKADGERLRQVVLNLVGNAVKFTDRGDVTITFHGTLAGDGRSTLVLAVRDTGPGIPPADQPRLFNAFSRLEFTAHKEGSGLGLTLAAALCRAMQGSLVVESDGASGSCFTATFAGEHVAAPAAPGAARPAASLVGCRVLVVDDNTLVRELFVASLADCGARCAAAGTAAEALAAVEAERPEVVVLDLALPDDDGTRLAPRLRKLVPGVRIVGVSAHAGAAEREQALAAGMNAFLAKPVALDELAAQVAGGTVTAPALTAPERPDLRARLEREFRRELPAKRAELAAAIAAAHWRRARATAHYLANSAAVIRDEPLLEACVALALAAEHADAGAVRAGWAECDRQLARWAPDPSDLHARAAR